MSVLLNVALSLGILVHAATMPVFAIWIFVGGPEKRWQTSLATLATLAGIFAYLIALTDHPSACYIILGIMRGLFEVQRGMFLRVFLGPVSVAFGLVVVANSLGNYTYNLSLAPVIVSFVACVLCYGVALFVLYLLRRMQGGKSTLSLLMAFSYAAVIIVFFGLSPAFFDVISHSAEFLVYVLLDAFLLIVPAFYHGLAYYYKDPSVLPFDYISIQQGLKDEFLQIEANSTAPEQRLRASYYHDGGIPVEDLPPEEEGPSEWRPPRFLNEMEQ